MRDGAEVFLSCALISELHSYIQGNLDQMCVVLMCAYIRGVFNDVRGGAELFFQHQKSMEGHIPVTEEWLPGPF